MVSQASTSIIPTMTDIHQFVTRYSSAMDLRALSETDMANVLDSIRQLIRSEGQDRQHHLAALTAVKILSRARDWVDLWMSEEIFNWLIVSSHLNRYKTAGDSVTSPDSGDMDTVVEAVKCIYNLTFTNRKVQLMCEKEQCVLELLNRCKIYSHGSIPHSLKLFDLKLMFLITALVSSAASSAAKDWCGVSTLTQLLQDILPANPQSSIGLICYRDRHLEVTKHCCNLWTLLPSKLAHILVPAADELNDVSKVQRSFLGHDVTAIFEILSYLEMLLKDVSVRAQQDQLLPVLLPLTTLCKSNRIIRKYCRCQVLPPLKDEVKQLPEEGNSLRNKFCKLLTSTVTQVKHVAADFLYVLCKENVSRLIKYTGFGNAAGLLAQYGLMSGQSSTSTAYSDDSDSDTEEYRDLESQVNHVTGRCEPVRPNPMEGMSDEQKEYEAMQLLNAMDKLQRLGVVQPSTIGPDGKPVPVEHVLQLAPDIDNTENNED
ncbi:RIC8B [Bugula neritina]|uniref:RIC8B n=1 Tax=Bugula neritina TaxID=10212 RepID=A0A7J7KNP3_BUGNE|nr:RIC8B [Bugula neritina]